MGGHVLQAVKVELQTDTVRPAQQARETVFTAAIDMGKDTNKQSQCMKMTNTVEAEVFQGMDMPGTKVKDMEYYAGVADDTITGSNLATKTASTSASILGPLRRGALCDTTAPPTATARRPMLQWPISRMPTSGACCPSRGRSASR